MRGRNERRERRDLARAVEKRCAASHANLVSAQPGQNGRGEAFAVLAGCPEPCLAELLLDRTLTEREAVELVGGVALAVEALAAAGLVARDLTPHHVHFDPRRGGLLRDVAMPLEFLVRPALEADEHLAYRAPEELQGGEADLRSNVYSLGALLFASLVGAPPFGGTWSNVYLSHLNGKRPRASEQRPGLASDIDSVIARAMAVDPNDRFERPTQLACAAATALKLEPSMAAALAPPEHATAPAPAELVPAAAANGASPATPTAPAGAAAMHTNGAGAANSSADKATDPAADREADGVRGKRRWRKGSSGGTPSPRTAPPAHSESAARRKPAARRAKSADAGARPVEPAKATARPTPAAAKPADPAKRAARPTPAAAESAKPASRAPKSRPAPTTPSGSASATAERTTPRFTSLPEVGRTVVLTGPRLSAAKRSGTPALVATLRRPRSRFAHAREGGAPDPGHRNPSNGSSKVAASGSRPSKASTEPARRNATLRAGRAKSNRTRARSTAGTRTTRTAFRAQTMTMVTLGLLAVAAVLTAHAMNDGEQPLRPVTISAGELSVQAPAGWQQTNLTNGRLGSLSGSLAAAPAGRADVALTAGVIREPAATERELRQLSPEGAEAAVERLGRLEMLRYAGLRPRPRTAGTAYLLHTTGPSILIMCQAPTASGAHALMACAKAASTVRLRGERPVPLEVAERRAPAVSAALSTLHAERFAARRRIAAAALADEQAAATRELQVSYEKAWGRVVEIGMPGTEAADLLTALGEAAAAYGSLATAISAGDQPGYDEARAAVDEAEAIIWSETGQFAR